MPKSISQEIFNGIGEAMADIRQNALEQPLYGREVTGGYEEPAPAWPEAREQEPEQDMEQEKDVDIDR